MQAEIFTLCDAATISSGKLNILGSFDTIRCEAFPSRHPQCAIACKIRFYDNESGGHRLTFKIIDPDGRDVIPHAEVRIGPFASGRGSETHMNIWYINGFPMDGPGEFFVDLLVDNSLVARCPLYVTKIDSLKA